MQRALLVPITAIALACALPLASTLAPRPGAPVAALFALADPEAALLRALAAGATPITIGALPGLVVVRGDPGLPQRLREAGALLVLAAPGVRGCR